MHLLLEFLPCSAALLAVLPSRSSRRAGSTGGDMMHMTDMTFELLFIASSPAIDLHSSIRSIHRYTVVGGGGDLVFLKFGGINVY